MNINCEPGSCGPEEEKLVLFLIKVQEEGNCMDASECGSSETTTFDYCHSTIKNMSMVEQNIPLPPGNMTTVVWLLKEKI